ncbi:MAG TPA: tetratricopeptide repeat protein, partial [Vicinamibacteria bacterium]|nr:tetratricopeptide repeat protein [Vicinamibacteria bacterium]
MGSSLPWLAAWLLAAALLAIGQPATTPAREQARRLSAEGLQLLQADRPALAEAKLEQAVKLDPTRADAHYGLGVVREKRGDLPAAR